MQGVLLFQGVPDGFIVGNESGIYLCTSPDNGIGRFFRRGYERRKAVCADPVKPYHAVVGDVHQSVVVEVGQVDLRLRLIPSSAVADAWGNERQLNGSVGIECLA